MDQQRIRSGQRGEVDHWVRRTLDWLGRYCLFHHAIKKLNKAIKRVDGYAVRGCLDRKGKRRDWVTDEAAQLAIYELLTDAVELLESPE